MENTFHIQWHITDYCNLRCRHCYQENFTPENNLTFEKIKKIFNKIEDFLDNQHKKLVIDLTGGEIFLHKNWKEILEMVYYSPWTEKTGIITNGFFFNNETVDFFKNFPEIEIKISSEGFDKEKYDFYRGKGNFEKFIRKMEFLKEFDFEKTLMFTVMENNAEQIEKIFDFSKKYGFKKFVIERFIPWGRGLENKEKVINLDKWCECVRFLFEKCKIDFYIETVLPYRGFMVKIEGDENSLYGAECIVGKDGFALMPAGDVFPCRRFPLKIGNLIEDDLIEIWKNSPVLEKIRDKNSLKGLCKNCKIDDCYGCRALAYSLKNDFLEEDTLCFLKCDEV